MSQQFKQTVEKILSKHGFVDTEFASLFEAMSEVLEARIELMPDYATKTIERYRDVARDIYDMESFIDDAE